MEYVRAVEPFTDNGVRQIDLVLQWDYVRYLLAILIAQQFIKKVKVNGGVYYKLTPYAWNWLERRGKTSFVEGNPRVEFLERATGRRFWRPQDIILAKKRGERAGRRYP